jgi:hypothetical protein
MSPTSVKCYLGPSGPTQRSVWRSADEGLEVLHRTNTPQRGSRRKGSTESRPMYPCSVTPDAPSVCEIQQDP